MITAEILSEITCTMYEHFLGQNGVKAKMVRKQFNFSIINFLCLATLTIIINNQYFDTIAIDNQTTANSCPIPNNNQFISVFRIKEGF